MRLKDRHFMCVTCHVPRQKGWQGTCPHCNPKQLEPYECPGARWRHTPWARVLVTWSAFQDAAQEFFMIVISAFLPKYLIWLSAKWPFIHVRKGKRVA